MAGEKFDKETNRAALKKKIEAVSRNEDLTEINPEEVRELGLGVFLAKKKIELRRAGEDATKKIEKTATTAVKNGADEEEVKKSTETAVAAVTETKKEFEDTIENKENENEKGIKNPIYSKAELGGTALAFQDEDEKEFIKTGGVSPVEEVKATSTTPKTTEPIVVTTPVIPVVSTGPVSPTAPHVEPTPPAATEKLEDKLETARNVYFEKYAEFKKARGWSANAKTFIFGGDLKAEDIEGTDKGLADDFRAAQKAYNQSLLELSNKMIAEGKDPSEITNLVVGEQELLAKEGKPFVPEKVAFIAKRFGEQYMKIKPPKLRQAISTVVVYGAFTAGMLAVGSGSIAAAGGAGAYFGVRVARGLTSGLVGQLLVSAKNKFWKTAEQDVAKIEQEFKDSAETKEFGKTPLTMRALEVLQAANKEKIQKEKKARLKHFVVDSIIRAASGMGVAWGTGALQHHFMGGGGAVETNPSGHEPYDPTKSPLHGPALKPAFDPNHPPIIVEPHKIAEDALIHKGEGISHALHRQLEHNPDVAKALGYDHATTAAEKNAILYKLLHERGYISDNGSDVRVIDGQHAAYELRVDHGKVIVDEYRNGSLVESHGDGAKFGIDKQEHPFEYEHDKKIGVHTHTAENPYGSGGSAGGTAENPYPNGAGGSAGTGTAENPYAAGNGSGMKVPPGFFDHHPQHHGAVNHIDNSGEHPASDSASSQFDKMTPSEARFLEHTHFKHEWIRFIKNHPGLNLDPQNVVHGEGGPLRFKYEFPDHHAASVGSNLDDTYERQAHEAGNAAAQAPVAPRVPYVNPLETYIDPTQRMELLNTPVVTESHGGLWLLENHDTDKIFALHKFILNFQTHGYAPHQNETIASYMRRIMTEHEAFKNTGTAQPMMNPANPSQTSGFQINGRPDYLTIWRQENPQEYAWLQQNKLLDNL